MQKTKNDTTISTKEVVKRKKNISKDTEIVIMNNSNAIFLYKSKITLQEYRMSDYGDIEYITVDELLRIKNSHKVMLENLWIRIIEVMDEEISVEDVITYLRLETVYNDVNKIKDVDDLILKSNKSNFEKIITNYNKAVVEKVIERAIELFREKKFDDYAKMEIIKTFTKKEDLFEDIKNTQ